MTLDEMKAAQAAVAAALNANDEFTDVEPLPFEPGELPDVTFTYKQEDLYVTIGVA